MTILDWLAASAVDEPELPLWLIHIAWPLTGLAWIVFLGEQVADEIGVLTGRLPA